MEFYDDVMRELLFALGAALFLGNVFALIRRRNPPARVKARSDEPVLTVPVARTVAYAAIGFVVMIWGLASMANS